jgi:hypothetical protein
MRKLLLMSLVAGAGALLVAQTASAERVCREVCDGGTCVQKCVEHHDDDRVIIDRDRPRPGVELHAPGVGVEIGH